MNFSKLSDFSSSWYCLFLDVPTIFLYTTIPTSPATQIVPITIPAISPADILLFFFFSGCCPFSGTIVFVDVIDVILVDVTDVAVDVFVDVVDVVVDVDVTGTIS